MGNNEYFLNEVIRAKAMGLRSGHPYAQYVPEGDGRITHKEALDGINKIRNSIVGLQSINWSEHIYPMVELLDRAGLSGVDYPQNKQNFGTLLDAYVAAIALLKSSPCLKGNSEWRLEVETFLKLVGRDEK